VTGPAAPQRAAAAAADRRVLALLESYVSLAGGSLIPLEPDLYQLNVPRGDETHFGGRSAVRVAFSVDALELDDRAEMAIVGSAFVGELIEAIRARGARRHAGWVVPSDAVADAAPPLPLPARNATSGDAHSALARHRVGRLTARVAIRAGTELRERLADSSLYDLCSGIPLANDLAGACEKAVPSTAAADRWREMESVAIQRIPSLVDKMLADLEMSLRPEIEQVARIADGSLREELARIERYYAEMLADIGGRGTEIADADARRAIEAEYERRAGEERDRHAVRAVVHPLQLTEWEMVVQRATWKLVTASRHEASFTAQRALAGAGTWAYGCDTCGTTRPNGLHVCRHDHLACDACASTCGVCGESYCREHGIAACHVDGKPACDDHARMCKVCRRSHCSLHEGVCDDGGHAACSTCLAACVICGRAVCDSHALISGADAPRGTRRFCQACARTCEGGTGEVVGPDEVERCASCERSVCERHQNRCAVDGDIHCSRHLRRTDRSRRLVCEHDRAACVLEANAVFARDEVAPCATCGRLSCEEHRATCVVDEQRHCSDHVVPVADRPGAFACREHVSTCHVDGRQYSTAGTHECPCCGRRTCAGHTRECERCRRGVCTADYSPANPKICATCTKLAPDGDPDDALIAAAVELRGLDAPSPRSWKVARDARHLVAELDFGWTRRLVIAVPHGATRAERAVSTSLLGSRVLR
jgi:hypothetical protein